MNNVIVPQEWPRRKKVRSIAITVLFVVIVLLISVN
jgi:preprotein translocase subunit SecE